MGAVGFSLLSRKFFGPENYSKAYSVIGLLTTTGSYLPMFWIALGFHCVNLTLLGIVVKKTKNPYN